MPLWYTKHRGMPTRLIKGIFSVSNSSQTYNEGEGGGHDADLSLHLAQFRTREAKTKQSLNSLIGCSLCGTVFESLRVPCCVVGLFQYTLSRHNSLVCL